VKIIYECVGFFLFPRWIPSYMRVFGPRKGSFVSGLPLDPGFLFFLI
jgi:hypothetical protein